MSLITKAIAGGVAGAALLLSAGAAYAVPGAATGSVNVRTCGSTTCAIVDQLSPGEGVDIQRCAGSWCFVRHTGNDGWVSASYLDRGGGYYRPAPRRVYRAPVYRPAPRVYSEFFFDSPRYYRPRRVFRHRVYRPAYPTFFPPYRSYRYRHYDRFSGPGFCTGSRNFSFCINP